MTLNDIYNEFTIGSLGFVLAIETHAGVDCSREEIERIAGKAPTADEFMRIWSDEAWWRDENQTTYTLFWIREDGQGGYEMGTFATEAEAEAAIPAAEAELLDLSDDDAHKAEIHAGGWKVAKNCNEEDAA